MAQLEETIRQFSLLIRRLMKHLHSDLYHHQCLLHASKVSTISLVFRLPDHKPQRYGSNMKPLFYDYMAIIWPHNEKNCLAGMCSDKTQIHQLKVNMKSLVTFRGSDYDLFVNGGKV